MARFPCPFNVSSLPCSPNWGTIFNPNGSSWGSYYAFRVELNGLTFNDSMFNDSGKLKAATTLVNNSNGGSPGDMGYQHNWFLRFNTDNKLQMRYWFWDSGRGRWYYSTTSTACDWSYDTWANKPNGNNGRYAGFYTISAITIQKGHKYNFLLTKPSNNSFKFQLKDVDTGTTQEYTWTAAAWNNNYAGKNLNIGAAGMSFDSGVISGYPYDSNCLHTIRINDSTWNGTSNTITIPITSNCGYSNSISYTNTTLHKLNVVLSDVSELGFYAKSTTGEADKLNWFGAGTYNATTKTWTKWYAEGDTLDFPNAWRIVNMGMMNTPIGNGGGYRSLRNCMFVGWSTTLGGDLVYNDWDTYTMGTSDITIYPRIITFGDLQATTGNGIIDYDGPGGSLKYATIKPNVADTDLGTVDGSGLKLWAKYIAHDTATSPGTAGMDRLKNTDAVTMNPSVAGTVYNILPGQNVRGRYIYSFYISSDPSKAIPDGGAYFDSTKGKYYFKTGSALVKINTILLPVPTKNGQLTYNGTEQTQAFNNFETEYMTVQYNKGIDAGTYTAIFTLKDTVVTHWADDSTDQKTVTWTINKKNVTPTFGTTTWTFDGDEHSTTVGLTGVVSGDICNPAVSGNAITDPGTKTVTVTGVDNPNYQLTGTTTTTLTVNKKNLTLEWDKDIKEYDGTILTPDLEVSGYVSGYKPTVTPSSSTSANIGYYTSTATMSGTNAKYYNLPADPTHQLQITPRPVKITWAPIQKNYDGTTLTSIPTITNLVGSDTCNMTIVNNTIGPAASSQIAEVTALSNNSYTLDGSTGRTQLIIIRDVLDPEHGKVYVRTAAGTWQLVM